MKKIILCLCLIMLPLQFAIANDRIGDFALLDHNGTFHQLSYYDDMQAVVVLVHAVQCEALQQSVSGFKVAQAAFEPRGVEFMLLNAEGSTREILRREADRLGLNMPILMDDAQLVSESLGVRHAGEVLVLDPLTFSIVFRGPVGAGLTAAINQVLAGESVLEAELPGTGCAIQYAARDQHRQSGISYVSDVAPIIAKNCTECHRQNSIAPFALDSHQMVQGWSPMIREVVMTKRMPPGQVDPHVGNVIGMSNLSNADQQTLIHWIDAGALKDGETDPLAALVWPDSKWRSEPGTEPDLIVKIPPQQIPATGVIEYLNIVVDIPLQEDVWIRGSEIVPGDYSVLHHVITRIVAPDENGDDVVTEEGDDEFVGQDKTDVPLARLSGYVPGRRPSLTPNGGGLLRKGSAARFQLHYTTSGREVLDESELGIYFYPQGVVPEIEKRSGGRALNARFEIPAFAKDYEVVQSAFVEKDAYLLSFMPHMHFRGKRMKFVAKLPDGTEQEILSVPHYQFNWQVRHQIEPMFVPAGTEIVAIGAFDNSAQNQFNPDPSQDIDWGPQSWDEMFIGYMRWQHVEDMK